MAMIRKTKAQLNMVINGGDLQSFDHLPDFIFAFSKLLLESAEQLIIFPLCEREIVVRQIAIALF